MHQWVVWLWVSMEIVLFTCVGTFCDFSTRFWKKLWFYHPNLAGEVIESRVYIAGARNPIEPNGLAGCNAAGPR